MLNGEIGYGGGYGGSDLPFYKNYYGGGIGSVRGYDTGSLGPTQLNQQGEEERLGGTRKIVANAELLYSVPKYEKSVRLGAFFDAGQIYAKDCKNGDCDFRYSAGLSLLWVSPMGPLKFNVAQPLNKRSGDKIERFQFQLGTSF